MKTNLLFFMIIWLVSLSYSQKNSILDVSGFLSMSYGIISIEDSRISSTTFYLARNALRLNLSNSVDSFFKIDGSIDFNVLYGLYGNLFLTKQEVIKLSENTSFLINIRKFYLACGLGIFDFYLGKQLLKFGEGTLFSPLNFFDKIDFADIKFSRTGVNSFRIKTELSPKSYIDFIVLTENDFCNTDLATKFKCEIFSWDSSFVGFYRWQSKECFYGISFKGDLLVGLYGELLYNFADGNYFSYMLGLDYSFAKKLAIKLEYTYNSYNQKNYTFERKKVLPNYPFISKSYVFSQISYFLTLIDNISISYVANLENANYFYTFSYQRNLHQYFNLLATIRYINNDVLVSDNILPNALIFLVDFIIRY